MVASAPPSVSDPAGMIVELEGLLAEWKQFSVDDLGLSDKADARERLESFSNTADDAIKPFTERLADESTG